MRRLLIMAVTAVLTALAPAAARESALPVVPSIRDPAFQAEILNAHNRERRPLGVAPLVWSDALAEEAEAWAARLRAAGVSAAYSEPLSESCGVRCHANDTRGSSG